MAGGEVEMARLSGMRVYMHGQALYTADECTCRLPACSQPSAGWCARPRIFSTDLFQRQMTVARVDPETAEKRKGAISTSTRLMVLTLVSSRRRTARGVFKPEFGRHSQDFRTEWHTGIVAGWKKAFALAVWFTVNNGADIANNVPVTPDTVPTSPV